MLQLQDPTRVKVEAEALMTTPKMSMTQILVNLVTKARVKAKAKVRMTALTIASTPAPSALITPMTTTTLPKRSATTPLAATAEDSIIDSDAPLT